MTQLSKAIMGQDYLQHEQVFPDGPRIPNVPENFFTLFTTFREQLLGRSTFKSEDLSEETRNSLLCLEEAVTDLGTNVFYDGITVFEMNELSRTKQYTTQELVDIVKLEKAKISNYNQQLSEINESNHPTTLVKANLNEALKLKEEIHEALVNRLSENEDLDESLLQQELKLDELILDLKSKLDNETNIIRERKLSQNIIRMCEKALKIRKWYGNWQLALTNYWKSEQQLYGLWCKKMVEKGYWGNYLQYAIERGII